MPLTKYTKAVTERKRYLIDYTNWLDATELVANISFSVRNNTTTSPLVVDTPAILPGGYEVQYFVSGGVDGVAYEVLATMTTSGGQIKLDSILFSVREP